MIASTMIIIRPENLDVKAVGGGGGGDEVGINTTYIHFIAQNLSQIVFTNSKGRAFGTPGEHLARSYIKNWMNLIGLSNVHLENITGTTQHHELNTTVDIISEGIKIDDQRLTDFYISPIANYTGLSVHHFSWDNLEVRIPLQFPWFDRLCNKLSFINDLLAGESNDSIHNFTTYFEFCKKKFEKEYNFSFDTFNASDPETYPTFIQGTLPDTSGWSPFLFIEEDRNFNPNFRIPWRFKFLNPLDNNVIIHDRIVLGIEIFFWQKIYHPLKGIIKFDYNNDTYNMQNMNYNISILFINRSIGRQLFDSIEDGEPSDTKVSFWVNESYNESVNSSNVVGQINGTNANKIVIIDCLYDCWWNQGAADSAIGMGTVLAIAKYFKDHHIKPKYTLKFVAFAGEEKGYTGAQYYNDTHQNEHIETIIDLNQFGFSQTGPRPQTFFVNTNKVLLKSKLECIIKDTHYCERTGTPYLHFGLERNGGPSDCYPFLYKSNHSRDTILFAKDVNWTMHHRDGEGHTKGDTMDYYDSVDVEATADMIWNVTKYFVVNPNCSFDGSITYTTKDSPNDEDNLVDTVEVNMSLQSILPSDLVRVKAVLKKHWWSLPTATVEKDFVINNSVTNHTMDITLPPYKDEGNYSVYLYLYNSTGRLNLITSFGLNNHPNATKHSDSTFHLYPRGNEKPTKPSKPVGPTTLRIGQKGTWTSTTTDPNHDLVGEKWYTKYSIIPPYIKFKDTGLFDPESPSPSVSHRFWVIGTHHLKVKAYDQFSGPLHPYNSSYSDVKDVTVKLFTGINSCQQLQHQGNTLHMVQNVSKTLYGVQTGGTSVQWLWDDGHQHRYTQRNATYTFTNTGTHNITLNVTDSQTQITGTATIPVRVSVLDSDFNMSYFHGAAPDTLIHFRNTSKTQTNNRITNCTWNFSDGTISYQSNVNHTFTQDGDYNVTLTVKDNQNHTDVDYCVLHITSDPRLPEIPDVQSPEMITNASDATILAEVDPTDRNLTNVAIQITTPNGTLGNYTMTNLVDDIYIFTLNNSSQNGQYNFTITATDSENNTNSTSGSYIMTLPYLSYEPPTPEDNASVNHPWVTVNASIVDPFNTSAFIDWNRSLKGYWSMDAYNATCIYDNSTYENLGWFHNGINASNITMGKYGKGLQFDGADDYVDLGNDTSLNLGTGDFTFMVWEKSHATSYANTTVILSNQPEDANGIGYVFGVKNTPYFYTVRNGQSTMVNGAHDVTDNTWHHLAYVRKGSNLSIYVDGTFDGGNTGMLRNITNNKDTCLSYENRTDWYHFDGVLDEAQLYSRALGRDEINASYNNGLYRLCHNFTGLSERTYQYYAHAIDSTGSQGTTMAQQVTIAVPPVIRDVSASPHTVGFGYNVTVTANVTDNGSGVNNVTVQFHYGYASPEYAMNHLSGDTYQYVFTDTWMAGQYNFTIWAADNASNGNSSTGHHFHVSAEAQISIATLQDSYTREQYINITDPPTPPANYTLVGRGLNWNKYYDAVTGQNILMVSTGPINYQNESNVWTPINCTLQQITASNPAYAYGYRAGNDRGLYHVYFKPNAQNDWPVAFAYNKSTDPTTHVIRSKLVGVGYVDPESNWAYHYLQGVQGSQGQITGNAVTYPGVFTGTDVTWSYGNTGLKEAITMSNATKTVLLNHPPSMYGLNNGSSYLVFITKLDHQNLNLYNSSGMLDGNVTISDAGVDFKDALGYFKCALPLGEAYELFNESVRQKLTYRIIHLNGNTYLLSGLKVSDLTAMTFPVMIDPTLTVYSTSSDGYIYNSGTNYNTVRTSSSGTVDSSGSYITIGQKTDNSAVPPPYYIYRGFVFFNTSELPSNAYLDSATLSLYKKDDYSSADFDITIQNGQPTYPHDRMQSSDYNKNNYSGNGGTFNTSYFTSGYNDISLTNLNWINMTGITKVCLRSSRDINGNTPTGNEYVTVYANEQGDGYQPKLSIIYSNQSKIKNTGSTNFKGYLLIQVQYREGEEWVVDQDTVNEMTPRTINASEQLGLDTIFNGLVKTDDLAHGSGTYRVYAAFRGPEGNILKTSDGVELVAWYEFEVNL